MPEDNPGTELAEVKPPRIDNYTGERLKRDHPDTYAQVIKLLAQPREEMSYRQIHLLTRCNRLTIQAVEREEVDSIVAYKLDLRNLARIGAQLFFERAIECAQEIKNPLQLATTGAIFTDKFLVLSGEATQTIQVNFKADDIYSKLATITATITDTVRSLPEPPKPIPVVDAILLD